MKLLTEIRIKKRIEEEGCIKRWERGEKKVRQGRRIQRYVSEFSDISRENSKKRRRRQRDKGKKREREREMRRKNGRKMEIYRQ